MHLIREFLGLSEYSVGTFYEDARQKTEEILLRGRVPIVTGGTGLYLRWYVCLYFNHGSFCFDRHNFDERNLLRVE